MKSYSLDEVKKFEGGFEIVPAILDQSIDDVKIKVEKVFGKAPRVGIDIIDGVFADNITVSVEDLAGVEFEDLIVEVQLMTEYPEELLGSCHTAGVKRVYGHVERMGSQHNFVGDCVDLGMEPALGLDLYTPLEAIEDECWEQITGVLLMGVKAGFSGQAFKPEVLKKIAGLRERGFEGDIQMDGGMNPQTIKQCVEAGANHFSVTSFVWKSESVDEALKKIYDEVR